MQLGERYFDNRLFVEGIRESIISLGQLDAEGCRTELSHGKVKVFGPSGNFKFSAFLHNGHYFLDTQFYFGPNIFEAKNAGNASTFAITDAKNDNTAELWHCQMGHANLPDIKRLQHLALGVQLSS